MRRSLLIKAGVAAVLLGVVALALVRASDPRAILEDGLAIIRELGPFAFFAAMAVLPAVGCPITVFTLSVGPVFGKQLGFPLILMLASASLAVNLAFTYGLVRYAVRPWAEWLFGRLGYRIPQVSNEDSLSVAILVRVTPGPPFFLQSYVLALGGVPFWTFMAVSWAITTCYAFAFILFGDSLAQGQGKMALSAVGLLIALSVGVQFLRRHYARKRAVKL